MILVPDTAAHTAFRSLRQMLLGDIRVIKVLDISSNVYGFLG